MKTFVISLKRAAERRAYMTRHLSELKLDYEIIDAVDYQELTPEDYSRLTDEEAVKKDVWLTKGAIACALSHVKIFNKIVDEKIPIALVLEDDAALPKNVKHILDKLGKQINDDEIIALSYYNRYNRRTELSLRQALPFEGTSQLLTPVNLGEVASAMAYIIPYNVAKKLKDIAMPVSVQFDYWNVYFDKGGFSSFRCLYPVVAKPAVFRSTLDYAAANTLFSRIAGWVRANNVPFLIWLLNKRAQRRVEEIYVFDLVDKAPFNAA